MDLVVIVPSRGRPHNIARLIDDWKTTGAWDDPQAHLLVAVDNDDPTIADYFALDQGLAVGDPEGLVATLNRHAVAHVVHGASQQSYQIGFAGDDHAPRTPGWTERIRTELNQLGTGIVYGNDLFQGPNLPTAVFMTADIVGALGYMAPPCLRHMFADNYWKDLGDGVRRIRYLPDVVIEHLHPHAGGKAPEDDRYRAVWPLMGPDGQAYNEFVDSGQLAADIAKVKELL